jgi:hypothetical protein
MAKAVAAILHQHIFIVLFLVLGEERHKSFILVDDDARIRYGVRFLNLGLNIIFLYPYGEVIFIPAFISNAEFFLSLLITVEEFFAAHLLRRK